MKIPYGQSNFAGLRRGGFFYVDKTPFLPVLESAESGYAYLVFLRPRRMGKSLLVSMMESYYDVAQAEHFDALFGGLWIHAHPTPERNAFLVLKLDFSIVAADGDPAALRGSFFEAIKVSVYQFLLTYRARVPELGRLLDRFDTFQSAEGLVGMVMGAVRAAGHRIYVLIDEYDNFANRLLSGGEHDAYEKLVTRTGFVRSFYAALKAGTASGAVARIFITGVAPLLLDDLSSGFNIASNVSNRPRLNTLAGFTHADVDRAVGLLLADDPALAADPDLGDHGRLLETLEDYYDGYRFSDGAKERVFNADMVLYFLCELAERGRFPADMLDLNVRTDYRRLQHIGMLAGAARDERRALLETIVTDPFIESPLVAQFGVRSLSGQAHFISLLYYLGLLTIAPPSPDAPVTGYRLTIPNRVIRELVWEHLARLLQEEGNLAIDTRDLGAALSAMAIQGDIAPFLDLFHTRVLEALGVKDLRRLDEKAIKLMMLAFISLSRLFYPLSEKEMAQGYCDLFLGVSPLHPVARFAWLLELKYLRAGAKPAEIERAFGEAAAQLERYAGDARLVPLLTQGRGMKAGTLVFVGAKRPLFRVWPAGAGGGAAKEKATRRKAKQRPS
jgi:hypothetical protein